MKKIFGILFALVLVVGLGPVTGTPVLADASPGWSHIDKVAAGHRHTVGLESDGTVIAVGSNSSGVPDVGTWANIKQVAAGGYHTVGLKNDGTVVAVGENYNGQCNVGNWTSVTQVAGGGWHTVGVKNNGTVVAVGNNINGQCNVSGWTNIIQVAAGYRHTVGLKADRTVVAVGDNSSGQCKVSGWTDIIQVAAGHHTVGLCSNGTVVAVGDNLYGQCNVSGWTNIVQVAAGYYHTVGVTSSGIVLAVGNNDWGQCGSGKTQTVTNGTVDAKSEADTEVVVNGTATVTVFQYSSNPGGSPPTGINALGKWIDVYVPDTSQVTEIQIRLYYTDADVTGIDESSLRLRWWNGSTWVLCSDRGVNTTNSDGYAGCMWAKVRADTTPSLAYLQGQELGGYHPEYPPGGGCSIATAAYGTDTAKELDILREFRDTVLLPNSLGARLVSFYYKASPPVANFISRHEFLRTVVRVSLVDPIVKILKWTHNLWSMPNS